MTWTPWGQGTQAIQKNEIGPCLVSSECPYWKKNSLCVNEVVTFLGLWKKIPMRPSNCTVPRALMQARVAQGAQDSPGQKTELLNSPLFFLCFSSPVRGGHEAVLKVGPAKWGGGRFCGSTLWQCPKAPLDLVLCCARWCQLQTQHLSWRTPVSSTWATYVIPSLPSQPLFLLGHLLFSDANHSCFIFFPPSFLPAL